MRISLQQHDGGIVARLAAPHLRPAQEHALLTTEAVDYRGWLAGQRHAVGLVGNRQAGVVADIFTQGQCAIDVIARQGRIAAVLRHQCLGFGGKFLAVVGGPPVAQIAHRIRLAALVIEAVADFMADHGNDTAIVHRVVGSGIKKRRLQNGCRKHDFIQARVVIGIHGLRRHAPLLTIDRLAESGDIALVLGGADALQVTDQIIPGDGDSRVIAPLAGVADLRIHGRQFGPRFFLGGGAHPVEAVDALAERRHQVGDQFFHARLVLRREMFFDITLAQCLAERAFDHANAALPRLLVGRHAAQHGAVEREAVLNVGFGKIGRVLADQMPFEIRFPGRQRGSFDRLAKAGKVTWLADDYRGDFAIEVGGAQLRIPVIAGYQLGQLREFELVVGLDRVAVFNAGPLRFGEFGFQRDDFLRADGRIFFTGLRQHFFNQRLILGAGVFQLGVGLVQVIIAIRQAQPALTQVHRVLGCILGILRDTERERRGNAHLVEIADQRRQLGLVLERIDARKVGLQRLQAQRLATCFVHETFVQIADFLRFTAGRLVFLRDDAVNNGTQIAQRVLAQFIE